MNFGQGAKLILVLSVHLRLMIRRAFLIMILASFLLASLAISPSHGRLETSWSETHLVAAGDSKAASGGRLDAPEVHVSGKLTIQSCCGFSTNDIMFAVVQQNGLDRIFGVVVSSFSFTWDTDGDSEYSLVFSTLFNQSSPSYHSKTIQVTATETSNSTSPNPLLPILYPMLGVAVGGGVLVAVLLVHSRRVHSKNAEGPAI